MTKPIIIAFLLGACLSTFLYFLPIIIIYSAWFLDQGKEIDDGRPPF